MSLIYHTGKNLIKSDMAKHLGQMLAMILVLFSLLFTSACLLGGESALAVEFDNGPGYSDALIGNNGWKSDAIAEGGGVDAADSSDLFKNGVSSFLFAIAGIIIVFSIVFSVGRIAGRGIFQILYGGKGQKQMDNARRAGDAGYSTLFALIMTSSERENSTMSDAWVFPMMKETFLFMLIGMGAGVIIGLIGFLAEWGMGQIFSSLPEDAKTFNFGGVSVTTQ